MPLLATKYFGAMEYHAEDAFHFPRGLPAFEQEQYFVLLNIPDKHPLVFLQSVETAGLCFLAFPVLVVDPKYELVVSFEDAAVLELEPEHQPEIGSDVLVLVILSVQEGKGPTANLLAPIVINLRNRIGVQAIRCDFCYSHQHALVESKATEASC